MKINIKEIFKKAKEEINSEDVYVYKENSIPSDLEDYYIDPTYGVGVSCDRDHSFGFEQPVMKKINLVKVDEWLYVTMNTLLEELTNDPILSDKRSGSNKIKFETQEKILSKYESSLIKMNKYMRYLFMNHLYDDKFTFVMQKINSIIIYDTTCKITIGYKTVVNKDGIRESQAIKGIGRKQSLWWTL